MNTSIEHQMITLAKQRQDILNQMVRLLKDKSFPLKERKDAFNCVEEFKCWDYYWVFDVEDCIELDGMEI